VDIISYQNSLHVLKFSTAVHKFCIIKINESIKRTEFSCELPYFPVFTRITSAWIHFVFPTKVVATIKSTPEMCAYPVCDIKKGIRKRVWMWVFVWLRWLVNLLHKLGEIWGRTEAARSNCFYFLPQNKHRATSWRFRVMQLKTYLQHFPVR